MRTDTIVWIVLSNVIVFTIITWIHHSRNARERAQEQKHHARSMEAKIVQISIGDVAFDQGPNGDKGEYVCVTMDWWPENKCDYEMCPWKDASILTTDLTSPKLQGLLKAFGGIILRIGGTQQDTIVYEENGTATTPCEPFAPSPYEEEQSHIFEHGCLSRNRWQEVTAFARTTNAKLIFGINAMFGRKGDHTNPWIDTNARSFLEFLRDANNDDGVGSNGNNNNNHPHAKLMDQIIGFEYGNELNYRNVTALEHATGFKQFHQLIQVVFGKEQTDSIRLIGPDLNQGLGGSFYRDFLPLVHDILWGVSWHDYVLGPGYGNVEMLDQRMMQASFLDEWATKDSTALSTKYPNLKLVMGESGGAYNSGNKEANNRFMDAFWYLHGLGRLAQNKHSMFCRQTFIGGNYELVDKHSHGPNPSYFAALLFKRIMGREVRFVNIVTEMTENDKEASDNVRVFAHCNLEQKQLGLLIINYNSSGDVSVDLKGFSMSDLVPRDEYLVTAASLRSKSVLINGKHPVVNPDGTDHLHARKVMDYERKILLDPQSYGFIHFSQHSAISQRKCGPYR